jgi:hypothetical protein
MPSSRVAATAQAATTSLMQCTPSTTRLAPTAMKNTRPATAVATRPALLRYGHPTTRMHPAKTAAFVA